MRRATLLALAGWLCGASSTSAAEGAVKFLLAGQVLVADPAPFQGGTLVGGVGQDFQGQFSAAFPGQCMDLKGDEALGPDDRVVMLLPVLNGVRVVETVKAGSIHVFEAVVVGSVNVLDPWTDANLFSATRMVKTVVELGSARLDQKETRLREAFREAGTQWVAACVKEIKDRCQPFVISGPILNPPSGLKAGGIWPVGASRGLRSGALLRGQSRSLEIRAVLPGYTVVGDKQASDSLLPAGGRFELMIAERPAERGEALVKLEGLGLSAPPNLREMDPRDSSALVSGEILLSLAREYLSKGQSLRVLPVPIPAQAVEQWEDLREQANRRFTYIRESGQSVSASRRRKTQEAAAYPDLGIEFRILNAFHGQRNRADGVLQHLLRFQLAATVLKYDKDVTDPTYSRENAPKGLLGMVDHTEELALEELQGIRKVDLNAAWFTVCRNGMVRLAEKLLAMLEKTPKTGPIFHEGRVADPGRVAWSARQPGPTQTLEWLRPGGEVMGLDGRSLGPFFQVLKSPQGYLNPSRLGRERLKPGDILRFRDPAVAKPLVWQMPPMLDPIAGIGSGEAEALLAKVLVPGLPGVQFFRQEGAGQAGEADKGLRLHVSAWAEREAAGTSLLTTQSRFRLLKIPEGPEALFKSGVQTEHSIPEEKTDSGFSALSPVDRQARRLRLMTESLERLVQMALQKGLLETIQRPLPEDP
jgi:hypothetical protein